MDKFTTVYLYLLVYIVFYGSTYRAPSRKSTSLHSRGTSLYGTVGPADFHMWKISRLLQLRLEFLNLNYTLIVLFSIFRQFTLTSVCMYQNVHKLVFKVKFVWAKITEIMTKNNRYEKNYHNMFCAENIFFALTCFRCILSL